MASTANVTLRVLRVHYEEVLRIFGDYKPQSWSSHETFTDLLFESVQYGELPKLDELSFKGIAYDARWEEGDCHAAGYSCVRFDEYGNELFNEYLEETPGMNIKHLMALICEPDKLIESIKAFSEAVTPIPWDNQKANSDLYKAKQLITEHS